MSLDRLLDPRSIAIVGLSDDPSKHGGRVLTSLRNVGFQGEIWGVNPRKPDVVGIPMFASLDQLPESPDLIASAVPASITPEIARDAVAAGAGAMIVFAGGFAETGSDGIDSQEELSSIVRDGGVRLLGPNSGGVIRPSTGLAVSFLTCLDRPGDEIRSGPVGLVTQSGGTGSYIHNLAAERGGGLGVSISTGNEADINIADGILALTHLDEIRVIALVMETIRDGAAFVSAITAAHEASKPVVICRLGTSDHGRAMTATHTGAMARPGEVLDGVLASLGVTIAETPAELLDVAEVIARSKTPTGERVGIVTHSGGIAILLTDLAERHSLRLPLPSAETTASLTDLLHHGTATNPLDMGGIIGGASRFADVVHTFETSGDFDVILAVSTAHPRAHTQERARSLIAGDSNAIHLWMAGDVGERGLRMLRDAGLPVTTEPRAAIRALAALTSEPAEPISILNRHAATPSAAAPDEALAKATISDWGVAVPDGEVARSRFEAQAISERLGGRVVVKVCSADIAHKTEIGGIETDVRSTDAAEAFDTVTANASRNRPKAVITGALVERQIRGLEVIVGGVTDPIFGAMILVGLGGISAESLTPAMGLVPGTIAEAQALMARVAGLLAALGRIDPLAASELAETLLLVANGFTSSEVIEFDINPLAWSGQRWVALDALIIPTASFTRPSPEAGQREEEQ